MKPVSDRILVKRDKPPETTAGGIILPDISRKREERKQQQGEVLAVGPGKLDEKTGERKPIDVKPGDRVMFGQWAGETVKFEGKDYFFLKESEVTAVVL